MTFGEAQIRNQIRNASLAMVYGRQLSEVFTPLVERCVNIKFEDGDFGVVPKSEKEQERLAAGKEVKNLPPELVERLEQDKPIYQVRYKTQAANAARSEEYMAILDVLSFGIQAMNVDPSVRHRVDLHRGVEEIARIRSVPAGVIRANDVVEELMKEEKAQQQGQQDMQMAVSGADVVQKMASATQTARM
jgi:hypothetical protein